MLRPLGYFVQALVCFFLLKACMGTNDAIDARNAQALTPAPAASAPNIP
jgi:hypothetical protein